jgi:YidC/Oxa1 family membrane protein insertase
MVAVVVVTNIIFPPVSRNRAPASADSLIAASSQPPAPQERQADPPAAVVAPTTTAPASARTADTVIVESALYRFGFATQGAALVSAEMLSFKSYTRDGPVQLAGRTPGGLVNHDVRANGQMIDLAALSFTPSTRHLVLNDGGGAKVLSLRHSSAEHGNIEIQYEFVPDNYLVNVRVVTSGRALADRLYLNLGPTLAVNEARVQEDEHALGYVVNSRDRGISTRRPTANSSAG